MLSVFSPSSRKPAVGDSLRFFRGTPMLPFCDSSELEKTRLVFIAAQQYGLVLERVKPFQRNKQVVFTAVNQDGLALQNARDVVLRLHDAPYVEECENIEEDGLGASKFLKDWNTVSKVGVRQEVLGFPSAAHGEVLELALVERNASRDPLRDKEIILSAVRQNGLALQHVRQEIILKGGTIEYGIRNNREKVFNPPLPDDVLVSVIGAQDREIVLAAVRQNGLALQYADKKLQQENEIFIAAIEGKFGLLSSSDFQFSLLPRSMQILFLQKRDVDEVILAAVKQNGMTLNYASDRLRNNKKVVLAAVKQNGLALDCASEALRNDKDVVLPAVEQNGLALKYASEALRGNNRANAGDRDITFAAVRQNREAFKIASKTFRGDREIAFAALDITGSISEWVADELKKDPKWIAAITGKWPTGVI